MLFFKKKSVEETVSKERFDYEAKNISKLMDLISDGFEVKFNRLTEGYEVTLKKNGVSASQISRGDAIINVHWPISVTLEVCHQRWQEQMGKTIEQYLSDK